MVCPLASQILSVVGEKPDNFIFIEHTPDLKSKLSFYGETFDLVSFDWDGTSYQNPHWKRLTREQVNNLMEE